ARNPDEYQGASRPISAEGSRPRKQAPGSNDGRSVHSDRDRHHGRPLPPPSPPTVRRNTFFGQFYLLQPNSPAISMCANTTVALTQLVSRIYLSSPTSPGLARTSSGCAGGHLPRRANERSIAVDFSLSPALFPTSCTGS